MKIIYLILISLSLYGNDVLTNQDILNMETYYNETNIMKTLGNVEEDFYKTTGDKNYKKYLKHYSKDINMKKGLYSLSYKKKKEPLLLSTGERKEIPAFELGLDYLTESAEKGNLLSAYFGFKFIETYFLTVNGNNGVTNKYFNFFAKKMMDNNYCPGYLYYARTLSGNYNKNRNYQEIKNVLSNGESACQNEEIYEHYRRAFLHDNAKNNTMLKISQKKEKGSNR